MALSLHVSGPRPSNLVAKGSGTPNYCHSSLKTIVPTARCHLQPQGLSILPAIGSSTQHPPGICSRLLRSKQQAPVRPAVSTQATGLDLSVLATTAPALRDAACFVVAGLGARVWTKLFDVLVTNGLLEQKLSRKLVHITTGPIFLMTWPLFSLNPWARVWAAAVPMLNAVRLLLVGLGVWKDEGLVSSVSRSGDRGELLKGPLYYCLVLIATTLLCWRDDPTGMVAVCLMCGGDGLADIIGRRFGRGNSLPYNPTKSWAGSLAMLLGGTAMAAGLVTYFCLLGYYECYSPAVLLPYLLVCSGIATVVESLPINQVLDDNLSVPVISAFAAMLLMPHAAAQAATLLVPL